MESKLLQVVLDVRNLERSIEFYRDLANLPYLRSADLSGHRVAYLDLGKAELLLVQRPDPMPASSSSLGQGVLITIRVTEIERLVALIRERHIRILRDLERSQWGELSILLSDPDGYSVLLNQANGN